MIWIIVSFLLGEGVDKIAMSALCFASLSGFKCRPGFLYVGAVNIRTTAFLVAGLSCVHCRMFSSLSGLHPLDVNNVYHLLFLSDNHKYPQVLSVSSGEQTLSSFQLLVETIVSTPLSLPLPTKALLQLCHWAHCGQSDRIY